MSRSFDPDEARAVAAEVAYPDPVQRERLSLVAKPGPRGRTHAKTAANPTTWMDAAACQGATDIMFPGDRPGAHKRLKLIAFIKEAQAICATCTVADKCEQWADVERPEAGMYNGQLWVRGKPSTLETAPRVDVVVPFTETRGRKREPIAHGTIGGYKVHRNRCETPCDECRQAKREYDRQRRSKETA